MLLWTRAWFVGLWDERLREKSRWRALSDALSDALILPIEASNRLLSRLSRSKIDDDWLGVKIKRSSAKLISQRKLKMKNYHHSWNRPEKKTNEKTLTWGQLILGRDKITSDVEWGRNKPQGYMCALLEYNSTVPLKWIAIASRWLINIVHVSRYNWSLRLGDNK